MDGLDDMIKSLSVAKSPGLARSSSTSISPCEIPDVNEPLYTQDTEDNISALIRSYQSVLNDLADSKINQSINQGLATIRYSKFVEYYLENASLSNYSIETELDRMDFEVTFHGEFTTCKSTIQDIFWETKLNDLWRFANQSIYADVLQNLQSYFDGLHLNISARATSSKFHLDLDTTGMSAVGMFDVVIESHSLSNHRLKIASVAAHVEVCLQQRTLKQCLDPPTMLMVFDSDLRDAAITLLAAQDSQLDLDQLSSSVGEEGGVPAPPIDALVDVVTERAQALIADPGAVLTQQVEGAVGFFGRLLGAAGQGGSDSGNSNGNGGATNSNQVFGDLSSALRENMQPSQPCSQAEGESSCEQYNDNAVHCNKEQEEEWDEW